METIRVSCNQCGAPLEIGQGTRFVTCQYCNTRLEVQRSGNAVFTSVLDAIEGHTAQMAQNLEIIRLQNELEQLDRQWAIEREPLLLRRKNGQTVEPHAAIGSAAGFFFVVFFAIVAVGMGMTAMQSGAPGIFALVPFGMAILAVAGFLSAQSSFRKKADQYQTLRETYERQRARILAEIEARQRPEPPRAE